MNGKIFKWKTLPSNSPLVARQMPCNEKKKPQQQQVALKKRITFDWLEPLTRQRKKWHLGDFEYSFFNKIPIDRSPSQTIATISSSLWYHHLLEQVVFHLFLLAGYWLLNKSGHDYKRCIQVHVNSLNPERTKKQHTQIFTKMTTSVKPLHFVIMIIRRGVLEQNSVAGRRC